MDRDQLQEKLEKYGAGFINFLEEKYLAAEKTSSKGKPPAVEASTSCVTVKANSEVCTTSYASPLDRDKEMASRNELAKLEEMINNLLNGEQSSK